MKDALKVLRKKFKEFFERLADAPYTSVPIWKPWRDY
jgi:hypothetical protein